MENTKARFDAKFSSARGRFKVRVLKQARKILRDILVTLVAIVALAMDGQRGHPPPAPAQERISHPQAPSDTLYQQPGSKAGRRQKQNRALERKQPFKKHSLKKRG